MERSKMSLVDPAWEYLDPTPDIFAMFQEFDKTFFGCTMDRVELKWSKRMTSCAGLMAPLEGRGGACSIRLSEPLLKLRPRKDLVQTLLHEMIHAHLHVTRNRESDPHGPKFKEIMHRINRIAGTNITVYHDFHDEVNLHKQHWWRCNGPCRNWKPYYGWVKRATNRAPAKNDFWWARHQQTCGGQYIKVKEPEGYGKKKEAQLQKSLGKNGNLLSKIKKKYNVNHPVSTVTTPKLIDMWKKNQTNITSPKTPLKTNNSTSPFQTKSSPPNSKNIKNIKSPSSNFSSNAVHVPFQTKSSPPNSKSIKSPSSSFSSNAGVTLGTNGSQQSINSILGQLHKENMQRRRQFSGQNDRSRIGNETKNKSQVNHVDRKPVYVDLTESPPSQPVSSKNNQNSPSISKKPNSLIKQVTPGSVQKSLSKIPQSSTRDFGKTLKDRNLHESNRSFLTKNVELSFKSADKPAKSPLSFSSVSPEKKHSLGFSPTSVSSQEKRSQLNSSNNSSSNITRKVSSPESNENHSLLSKKDTATSLLLLKKKRKRLLSISTDSSPDIQTPSSKSEKQSWAASSNLSSRLNPDFFTSSSYKDKNPLFSDSSSSSKEKKYFSSNSLSLNNSGKQILLNGSNSSSSSNKVRKPPSTTDSSSSPSPDNKDHKHSTARFPFSTSMDKTRKTILTNTSSSPLPNNKEKLKVNSSPSHIPMKRPFPTDSSPSNSAVKHKKVSHTELNSSSSSSSSSLSPEKNHSFTKSYSPLHSNRHKRKENLTSEEKKKKIKLLEQLFGDDSDSEVETDKMNRSQKSKYPDSSSSSSSSTSRNGPKSPQKSTSGSSFKKSTSKQIQSNRLDNYFTSPIKESPKDNPVIVDNDLASSSRISQSQSSQAIMVPCPICQKKVPELTINNHLDECLNMNLIRGSR